MTWNILQTNWPFKDEDVKQPKPAKERWFVDHAGITVFTGNKEQCVDYRRNVCQQGVVRHYQGVSEEYLAQRREEARFQWTGSGSRQDMAADPSPGVIWMNGSCYKRRCHRE
jgi:4-diphosphocytidyl-2C-methyl-D-erythritol kinase